MTTPLLQELIDDNRAWAAAITAQDPTFFPDLAKKQRPRVLWIGCADSRVPESVLLDRPPGDVFVVRNIANLYTGGDPAAAAVLQHGILNLDSIEAIIVCGHTHCGGADTAYKLSLGQEPIQRTSVLASWLAPLISLANDLRFTHPLPVTVGEEGHVHHECDHSNYTEKGKTATDEDFVEFLIRENVKRQVRNINESQIMQEAWARGSQVTVHGWIYTLETGQVVDITGPFSQNQSKEVLSKEVVEARDETRPARGAELFGRSIYKSQKTRRRRTIVGLVRTWFGI